MAKEITRTITVPIDTMNPTSGDKAGYQNRKLTFDENTLRDDNGRAIMMEWEKPLVIKEINKS